MKLNKLYENTKGPIIPQDINITPDRVTLYFNDSFTYNHYHARSDSSKGIISLGIDPGDYLEFTLTTNRLGNLDGELKLFDDDSRQLRSIDGWEVEEKNLPWAKQTLSYFLEGLYKQFRKQEIDQVKEFIKRKIS